MAGDWLVLSDEGRSLHPTREAALAHAQRLVDDRGGRIAGGQWGALDQGDILVCQVRHRVWLAEGRDGLWGFEDMKER